MNIEIIDTPYKDRYCGNCRRITIANSGNMNKCCLRNNCYVSYYKWCEAWGPQYRVYKFEK